MLVRFGEKPYCTTTIDDDSPEGNLARNTSILRYRDVVVFQQNRMTDILKMMAVTSKISDVGVRPAAKKRTTPHLTSPESPLATNAYVPFQM